MIYSLPVDKTPPRKRLKQICELSKHFLCGAGLTRDVNGGTLCAVAMLVMYADSSGDSIYQVP